MEMDIYERDSSLLSLSNLGAVKAFYDAGVDIKSFHIQNYMEDVHYSTNNGIDILLAGAIQLFDEASLLDYEELEEREKLFPDGLPECAFVIKDERLSRVIESNYLNEFVESLPTHMQHFEYSEALFNIHSTNLYVELYFGYFMHELALELTKTDKKLNELIARIEEENSEVSNDIHRQAA